MLQLWFFYFFFPFNFGITFDALTTAVLTYVLNYAAYFAEIYRGGINSIDRGQYEAAHALGLSRKQTMFDIILPQTMKGYTSACSKRGDNAGKRYSSRIFPCSHRPDEGYQQRSKQDDQPDAVLLCRNNISFDDICADSS